MRKLNEFFLGEEAHWKDKAWFYGFYLTIAVLVVLVIFSKK